MFLKEELCNVNAIYMFFCLVFSVLGLFVKEMKLVLDKYTKQKLQELIVKALYGIIKGITTFRRTFIELFIFWPFRKNKINTVLFRFPQ